MNAQTTLTRPLAWLGRHAGAAIAAGVFLGLLVPPLAALCRPLLVPAILLPFVVALLRVDRAAIAAGLRVPLLPTVAVAWVLLASPAIVAGAARALGLAEPLAAILTTAAAAPPIMAASALALLLGLDVALAVLATVAASALAPFTLPPLALHLAGLPLEFDALSLLVRLAAMVGGCFVVAALLRRALTPAWLDARADLLGGFAVLGLIVFAVGIMDGVAARLAREPGPVLGYLAAAFALNVGLQALTALAMSPFGLRAALTLGLLAGNNNLGLVLAATAGAATESFVLFVAVAQFPIYLLPALQRPLYRRWLHRHDHKAGA
jgi:bile acid:Na+ symporter, BASS family